jgi:hypothetical protein
MHGLLAFVGYNPKADTGPEGKGWSVDSFSFYLM